MNLLRLMRQQLSSDEGFSLGELMIVTLLLGFILGAAYMVMGTVSKVSDDVIARGSAQDQGQTAIEKMTRELRMGQMLDTPTTPPVDTRFPQNTGTVCSFYADVDHDGTLQRITYTVSGGQLLRKTANATKSYPNMPSTADFGSDSANTLLATLDPSVSSVFTYVDSTGATNPAQGNVTAVQIKIKTTASSGASSMTVDIPTATVDVRSFQ